VAEKRGEQQHLPGIRDRKRPAGARPEARREKDGPLAPLAVDGEGVIDATCPEADERPAVRGRHDTPAQAGVEGDDTAGGSSAVERREGEVEGGVTADVQERPVEAANDPVA